MDILTKVILVLIAGIAGFAGSWGAFKMQMKTHDLRITNLEEKLDKEKSGRELLKDTLTEKIHDIDLKLSQIHGKIFNT